MNYKKISFSTGILQRQLGEKEVLAFAKGIGADAVDFNTTGSYYDYRKPDNIYSKSDEEIYEHFSAIKKYADSIGLEICQSHGRVEGFKNIPEEDEAMLENARRDLLAASALGTHYCVMHSVTTIFMGPDCEPNLMHDLNFDMFCKYLEYAKKYNVKIATETFGDAVRFNACDFFGNIDEFIKSYNRICAVGNNKDYLCVCVDTGHSNKASRFNSNPSPADVIRKLGNSIKVLHLNDNDKMTDQHKIPMTGDIDWNDVFDALDEVGYNGYYNMELNLGHFGNSFAKQTAEFAVKVMRNILDTRYNKN